MIHMKTILYLTISMLAIAGWSQSADPASKAPLLSVPLAAPNTNASAETFQPMNVNFGLFPDMPQAKGGRERKLAYTQRAKKDFVDWLEKTASLR